MVPLLCCCLQFTKLRDVIQSAGGQVVLCNDEVVPTATEFLSDGACVMWCETNAATHSWIQQLLARSSVVTFSSVSFVYFWLNCCLTFCNFLHVSHCTCPQKFIRLPFTLPNFTWIGSGVEIWASKTVRIENLAISLRTVKFLIADHAENLSLYARYVQVRNLDTIGQKATML